MDTVGELVQRQCCAVCRGKVHVKTEVPMELFDAMRIMHNVIAESGATRPGQAALMISPHQCVHSIFCTLFCCNIWQHSMPYVVAGQSSCWIPLCQRMKIMKIL
jgi:hypothetical protein